MGLLEQRVMADSEEQRVIAAAEEEPEGFLTALFTARHELLTIRTMAAQGGEIYGRAITLSTFAPKEGLKQMKDLLDQYTAAIANQPESAGLPDGGDGVLPRPH